MTFIRMRRRYVAFKALSPARLGKRQIQELIQRSILDLFGASGLSKIEPRIIEYDEGRSVGVIQCNHLYLPMLRASLACITAIGKEPLALFVLRVSGTLKALRAALEEDKIPSGGSLQDL